MRRKLQIASLAFWVVLATVLLGAVDVPPAEEEANGTVTFRGELVGNAAGDTRGTQLTSLYVDCYGESFGQVLGYGISYYSTTDGISYYSTTECSADMTYLKVDSLLQRRFGIWPFYSWHTVHSDSRYCLGGMGCKFVGAGGVLASPESGSYRVLGRHWLEWPPGITGTTYDITMYKGITIP